MVKDGANPEMLLAGNMAIVAHVGPPRAAMSGTGSWGRTTDGAGTAAGARSQRTYGFLGVVVSLKDFSASVWHGIPVMATTVAENGLER